MEIERICMYCNLWKQLPDQTELPLWGECIAAKHGILNKYMRPVPEKLETVAPFGCEAFQIGKRAVAEAVRKSKK